MFGRGRYDGIMAVVGEVSWFFVSTKRGWRRAFPKWTLSEMRNVLNVYSMVIQNHSHFQVGPFEDCQLTSEFNEVCIRVAIVCWWISLKTSSERWRFLQRILRVSCLSCHSQLSSVLTLDDFDIWQVFKENTCPDYLSELLTSTSRAKQCSRKRS